MCGKITNILSLWAIFRILVLMVLWSSVTAAVQMPHGTIHTAVSGMTPTNPHPTPRTAVHGTQIPTNGHPHESIPQQPGNAVGRNPTQPNSEE
jgi:hypothetical protein